MPSRRTLKWLVFSQKVLWRSGALWISLACFHGKAIAWISEWWIRWLPNGIRCCSRVGRFGAVGHPSSLAFDAGSEGAVHQSVVLDAPF